MQRHEADKGAVTVAMGEVDAELNRAAEENAAVALAIKELEEKNVCVCMYVYVCMYVCLNVS